MITYQLPSGWILYDKQMISDLLLEAHSKILALNHVPYRRSWLEELQEVELKREIAGTSRIEGAEFTDQELEQALDENSVQLVTRSQLQARAAKKAYAWLTALPEDFPANEGFILELHRHIVTGADDDHCTPGELRRSEQNVTFGLPVHRGATGGEECREAFGQFVRALEGEYRSHPPIIQAIASHYHIAAMHPFLDGNGRTARALEAFLLRKAGLRGGCFIMVSNYYYEEKAKYLETLRDVRQRGHDITPLIKFALIGIAQSADRVLRKLTTQVKRELFRNVMYEMFNRLKSTKKRVVGDRQVAILNHLLKKDSLELDEMYELMAVHYMNLKNPWKAFVRDLGGLLSLRALEATPQGSRLLLSVRLEWATEITETEFFERVKRLPEAKTNPFLNR